MRLKYHHVARLHAVLVFATGICLGLFVFLGILGAVYVVERAETEKTAHSILGHIENTLREREELFQHLKNLPEADCDQSMGRRVRILSHKYRSIHDILVFGFSGTVIRCSAVWGALEEPLDIGEPNHGSPRYSQRAYWLTQPLPFLDDNKQYIVSKMRHFGVVFDPEALSRRTADIHWQAYTSTRDGVFVDHGYGNPGLYDLYINAQTSVFPIRMIERACTTKDGNVCVLTFLPYVRALQNNLLTVSLAVPLGLMAGLLGALAANKALKHRRSIKGRVRRTIKKGALENFYCEYQPIIDSKRRQVVGVEALARYKDGFGRVSPAEFIPAVRTNRQHWAFTELILARVADDMQQLLPSRGDEFSVSLNFFPSDLKAENLAQVQQCKPLERLISSGVQVNCELLETGVDSDASIAETLSYLKQRGLKIAIDDFGTGKSNLEQLRSIDADYLKIDRSFVSEFSEGQESFKASFVPHILALAKATGLEVVAEGIETKAQADALMALGIRYMQGFHFARPMPVAALKEFIEAFPPHHADKSEAAA